MLIFDYTDYEDDRLQVETRGSEDFLTFCIPEDQTNHMEGRGVHVPRDEALRLYSALGEWLYPVHTPEGPNRSLIEELIAKAVKDQVAAVLPLHLAAGGALRISGPCKDHTDAGQDYDPEPRDVGHVEEPATPYQRPFHMTSEADCKVPGCTSQHLTGIHGRYQAPRPCDASMRPGERLSDVHEACGFLWALHKVIPPASGSKSRCTGCWNGNHPHVFRPCEKPGCGCRETAPEEASSKFERPLSPETQRRLMRELLPRRTRPRTAPKCLDCLHGWGEHTGGICWGTGGEDNEGDGCRCTRERPAAVNPFTGCPDCPHLHTDHAALNGGCTRCECTRERPSAAGTS